MSKRSAQQRYGSKAQNFVATIVDESDEWIARRQDEDFGIDMEFEHSEPYVRGDLLKIQVKSVTAATIEKGKVRVRMPKSLVSKADNMRIPVLLVWVDRENREAYYLWIQRWFLRRRAEGKTLADYPETITLWVPKTRTLRRGLRGELVNVARWKTTEQLTISLAATIRTAVAINEGSVLSPLNDLLAGLAKAPLDHTVNEVIDSVIELGPDIWGTDNGNAKAKFLYGVCRKLGNRFTPEQIERMVVRGDSYSRVGVNALGQLYDCHMFHLRRMKLTKRFLRLHQPEVAYFCALREAHPHKTVPDLIAKKADLVANGLRSSHDRLFDKWASRGDCALLDYLERITDSAS